MQGFPVLVAGYGAQCGSHGLWGGNIGCVGPTRPHTWCLLLLLLTGRVARVQSHPSPPDGALELLWL